MKNLKYHQKDCSIRATNRKSRQVMSAKVQAIGDKVLADYNTRMDDIVAAVRRKRDPILDEPFGKTHASFMRCVRYESASRFLINLGVYSHLE